MGHVRLEIGQVERHHFVADQLVDHGVGKQNVLGATVEAPQQQRRLLRIGAIHAAVKPRRSANSTPVYCVIPPGGENSTHVAHTVGFLREGR